jgi:hypothetical protein
MSSQQRIDNFLVQNPQVSLWTTKVIFLIVVVAILVLHNKIGSTGTLAWILWTIWGVALALKIKHPLDPEIAAYVYWSPLLR